MKQENFLEGADVLGNLQDISWILEKAFFTADLLANHYAETRNEAAEKLGFICIDELCLLQDKVNKTLHDVETLFEKAEVIKNE